VAWPVEHCDDLDVVQPLVRFAAPTAAAIPSPR
jgi:hypothetical protein